MTTNGVQWLLRGYARNIGLKVTPHQLRHTFARQMTEMGMPISSLSKLLGHARVSTTQVYTAGADPKLCRAYQEAMARLAARPPFEPESSTQVQTEPQTTILDPVSPAPLPDWDAWGTHLPTDLCQTSLTFVQRRVHTWKPRRRRERALQMPSQFRRFWEWQLKQRPIAATNELTLQDLRSYQTKYSLEGKKASTINNTLNCILGLLAEQIDQGEAVDASVFRL